MEMLIEILIKLISMSIDISRKLKKNYNKQAFHSFKMS